MQEADMTSSGYLGDDEDSNQPDEEEGDGEVTSAYNPTKVCDILAKKFCISFGFGWTIKM
jgi:hypothetical protein